MKATDKKQKTIEVDGKRMRLAGFTVAPPNVRLVLEDRELCLTFWTDLRPDAKPFKGPPSVLEIGDGAANDRDPWDGWRAVYPKRKRLNPKTDKEEMETARYWCKVKVTAADEGRKSATVDKAGVVAAVAEGMAPYVEPLKRAALEVTPPNRRAWWQNLLATHTRQTGATDTAKWRAVAHIVIQGAIVERAKPAGKRHSDFLTPRMLNNWIQKLNVPGTEPAAIEETLADNLRRMVAREKGRPGASA